MMKAMPNFFNLFILYYGEMDKQQQQQRGGAAWAVTDEKWGGTAPHSHCMHGKKNI